MHPHRSFQIWSYRFLSFVMELYYVHLIRRTCTVLYSIYTWCYVSSNKLAVV